MCQLPSPKGGRAPQSPIFGLCLLRPNGWMDQDGTWHGSGPRSRPHCSRWGLLDGDPAALPKKGQSPPFLAHVYCGQTAGWIKMALGMEVSLGAGHIVLDGDPAPLPKKGAELPIFSPFYCGQTAGCIRMPLGMEIGLSPGNFVLDGDSAHPHLKGHSPQFSANVRCGQTAA